MPAIHYAGMLPKSAGIKAPGASQGWQTESHVQYSEVLSIARYIIQSTLTSVQVLRPYSLKELLLFAKLLCLAASDCRQALYATCAVVDLDDVASRRVLNS